jgi:hypothetical protein
MSASVVDDVAHKEKEMAQGNAQSGAGRTDWKRDVFIPIAGMFGFAALLYGADVAAHVVKGDGLALDLVPVPGSCFHSPADSTKPACSFYTIRFEGGWPTVTSDDGRQL